MKKLFLLTEYQLRAIKKPLLWMLVLMGPAELAVMLLVSAKTRSKVYAPPQLLFKFAMFIPAICMILAVMINFWNFARQNGRSKGIYTLMTLPVRRSQLYWSGVLSGVIAVWTVMAAQAIWYLLLYAPTAWLNDLLSHQILSETLNPSQMGLINQYSSFVDNGLFLAMMRAPAMRILFPMSFGTAVVMLVSMICPVACVQGILCRRGVARIIQLALFAVSGLLTLWAMGMEFLSLGQAYANGLEWLKNTMIHWQLIVTVVSVCNALYGITTSKNI